MPLSVRVSVVISGQIFMLIFVISGNCITFVHEFRHHSGGVGRTLPKKGVIEIIFYIQTSQITEYYL